MTDTVLTHPEPSSLSTPDQIVGSVSRDELITLLVERAVERHEAAAAELAPKVEEAGKVLAEAVHALYADWHVRQMKMCAPYLAGMKRLARAAHRTEEGLQAATVSISVPPPDSVTISASQKNFGAVTFPSSFRTGRHDGVDIQNGLQSLLYSNAAKIDYLPIYLIVEGVGCRFSMEVTCLEFSLEGETRLVEARDAYYALKGQTTELNADRLRRKVTAALAQHALSKKGVQFDVDAVLALVK